MTDPIVQKKISYLQRIRRALFIKQKTQQKPGIPKFFQKITPTDLHWISHPKNMLPLFQKIILSIPESQRLLVLDGLNALPHSKDPSEDRFYVQDEIFRGVTGYYYFKLLPPYLISPAGLKEKKFYWLIRSGILAYEKAPLEKRKKFNKAVMPNVKKQNVVVPQRLQQCVR